MLFAGVAIILLIQLGIISIDNANLAKYILMIAIAVACGVVIIVIVCCCIECIRVQ
jgi:Na+/glutamate symporter